MCEYNLNEIKLAVINKNIQKLLKLADCTPQYKSVEEAKELLKYIDLAKLLIKEEKLKVFKEMEEIKKLKKFYEEKEGHFDLSG
ncbi:MAG: hypothetical protein GXO62_02465 [Epsilonproteobacteria bacterium]|nr:hypothetical protein [Campylobacterota bacterium]